MLVWPGATYRLRWLMRVQALDQHTSKASSLYSYDDLPHHRE